MSRYTCVYQYVKKLVKPHFSGGWNWPNIYNEFCVLPVKSMRIIL